MTLRRKSRLVDPIGWAAKAGRARDAQAVGGGYLLHFSMCWCRKVER